METENNDFKRLELISDEEQDDNWKYQRNFLIALGCLGLSFCAAIVVGYILVYL